MSKMENITSTEKSAGKKAAAPAESQRSYSLYDTCDKCPLWVYINLVCDKDIRALIKKGNPPTEELEEARDNIASEFAELSANTTMSSIHNCQRQIYFLKSQIYGLAISLHLVSSGEHVEAIDYINKQGLRIKAASFDKESVENIEKKIKNAIANRNIRLTQETKRLTEIAGGRQKGAEFTKTLFNDQLIHLSKHFGFRITKKITLAEYAGYIKDYQKSLSHVKTNKQ